MATTAAQPGAAADEAWLIRAQRGAYWTGSRLFVAVSAMLFVGGLFAYFYLRSLNSNGLWRAPGQRPSPELSFAVLVLVLASAGLFIWVSRSLRRGRRGPLDWRVASVTTIVLLVGALSLQIWELGRLRFFPGSSGFASVYVGVMPVYVAYLGIGAYWVETLLARSLRVRWVLAPVGENAQGQEVVAFNGSMNGAVLFLGFLSVLAATFFVLFSIIR